MTPKTTPSQIVIYTFFCIVFASLSIVLINYLLFYLTLIFVPAVQPIALSWLIAEIVILLSFYFCWTLRQRRQLMMLAAIYTISIIITLVLIPFYYSHTLTDIFGSNLLFYLVLLSIVAIWPFALARPAKGA